MLCEYLRFEEIQDLFYDGLMEEKIEVIVNRQDIFSTEISFDRDNFKMKNKINSSKGMPIGRESELVLNHSGSTKPDMNINEIEDLRSFRFVKYYKFLRQNSFPKFYPSSLLPPHGSNLFSLASSNKKIRELITILVKDLNLKLMLKSKDKKIELVKQKDDVITSFPYITTSDTLQRIIFFSTAMESNRDSTLIFEEPESFAFPYYTKYLGERIAFDEKNQYFISTHNPYLLLAILEKSPKDTVNVFVAHLEDSETKVRVLADEEIPILMDSEPFFNLGYFLEEE